MDLFDSFDTVTDSDTSKTGDVAIFRGFVSAKCCYVTGFTASR
jgi:hypothetical protein